MDIYSLVILIAAVTGLGLVVGGIYLLAKGIIKLVDDGKEGGTNLKIGDILSIGTTVPGLGIFLLGFVFEYAALYSANQVEDFPQKLQSAVAAEDSKLRAAGTLTLQGVVEVPNNQDALLTVCVGQTRDVPANTMFKTTVGPDYQNDLLLSISSAGERAQYFTIADPQSQAGGTAYDNLIVPKAGLGDLGKVVLQQQVNLAPALAHAQNVSAVAMTPVAAGSAYAQ